MVVYIFVWATSLWTCNKENFSQLQLKLTPAPVVPQARFVVFPTPPLREKIAYFLHMVSPSLFFRQKSAEHIETARKTDI
jgi:hypothetical protein